MNMRITKNCVAVTGGGRVELTTGDEVTPELAAVLGPGKIRSMSQVNLIVDEATFDKMFAAPEPAVVKPDVGSRGEEGESNPPAGPAWLASTVAELGLPKALTAELARRGQTVGDVLRYGREKGSLGLSDAKEKQVREAIESLAARHEPPSADGAESGSPLATSDEEPAAS